MSYCRQVTSSRVRPAIVPAILIFAFFSCRVPVNFTRGKPFVYKTTIKVEGNIKGDEKQDLEQRLENQLDDSLQTKTITSFYWPNIVAKKLTNPPVFDTANVGRSIFYMNALLNSNGFYAPIVKDTVIYKTVHKGKIIKSGKHKGESKEEQRVTIHFTVKPGKQLLFDSVGFRLTTPELQQIAIHSMDKSLIKVGKPYSRAVLIGEINRLVDSFRNSGYFRFNKEDLYVEHDTVFAALIDPSLDPIEQAELLEKLKQKKENPTVTVVIRQRPVRDSTHLKKYYIGEVTVYPDLPVGEDTVAVQTDTTLIHQIKFISRTNKFKLPFLANNIYLYPGGLYKQQHYYRTSNRLSQLPAWEYNNIEFQNSPLKDSLLDITLRMYPAKKQKVSISLETSYNTNDIVTTTNVLGTSLILGLQNRNAFRQSILTNTNLSGGIELGSHSIQTILTSLSHTIVIPRIVNIIPFVNFPANMENKGFHTQTLINVNANYTRRIDFFTFESINGSFGYQWSKTMLRTEKDKSFTVTKSFLWKPINIENTSLPVTSDSFNNLLEQNPPLQLSFRTGLVIGEQFAYNIVRSKENKINYFLVDFEESGALLGFFKSLDQGSLVRYIRGEVEFRHNIDYNKKNQLVFRAYGGAGYAYGLTSDGYEHTLPFFKAFYAGGANSMRAWQVRNLGLGSSKYYSYPSRSQYDLRFGDIKLEGNVEYRFLLGTVFGIRFKSALFTDIGNIWNWQPLNNTDTAVGSNFQLKNFYKELAYGAGTGLRMDFNYFLIRLDWAYKIHDPQALVGSESWFYKLSLGSGQLQLGINYPF
jgi:hypothetical protein